MGVVQVYINGNDIQSSNFVLKTITHDGSPNQSVQLQKIARRDGQKLISASFEPKTITIAGTVKGSTMADLEYQLDRIKRLCSLSNSKLDIEYAGGVRRYIVTSTSFAVTRAGFHLTFCPFSVSFECYDPAFAQNVGSLGGSRTYNDALSVENQQLQVLESTISFDGSAPPQPRTTYILDNGQNVKEIWERVIGTKNIIVVGTAFTSGDRVVIDSENRVVLLNGRPINYDGIFPEYQIGDQTIQTIISQRGTNDMTAAASQSQVDDFVKIEEDTFYIAQGFEPGADDYHFQFEVYMRRDINTTSGSVTLRIKDLSLTAVADFVSVTIPVTNIPIDGGWVKFGFTSVEFVEDNFFAILSTTGLNGAIYVGLAYGDLYQASLGPGNQRAAYNYSLNKGVTWKYEPNIDLAFRLLRTASSIPWRIDKKVDYIKRFL